MLIYERISAVVSATLIGLALYFVLNFPIQVTEITFFGSPVVLESPYRWLMVILLAALVMAGVDAVLRAQPNLPTRRLSYLATFWTLPALLVVLATQTLGLAPSAVAWAVSLVGVGILLWLIIIVEVNQIKPDGAVQLWPRLWQQLLGYAIALIFFIVIYQTRSRSIISATAILLVSSLTALALLRQHPKQITRTWLFAAVIGLSLGQMTWALNYWRTGALNAGLLLFLTFYLLVGLAQQQLLGVLSRRTLYEFGAVACIALIVIFNL